MKTKKTAHRSPITLLSAAAALLLPATIASAQWTAASGRIYYASGNVGLGTASNPVGRLDVRSNGTRTISAFNNASTGYNYAVHGTSLSNNGRGVYGIAQNVQGNGSGVFGVSNGYIGRGVYGYATDGRDGASYGVYGKANSTGGAGVYGQGTAGLGILGVTDSTASGNSPATSMAGVRGVVSSTTPGGFSAGVWGINNSTTGSGIGVGGFQNGTGWAVYGQVTGATGYAGYFVGGRNYFQGNVGVGTTPVHKLDVAGDMKLRTGDNLYFGSVGENSDTVYIERSNPGSNTTYLDFVIGDDPTASSRDYVRVRDSSSTQTIWFGSDGSAWKPTGSSWSISSDRRVKRDITDLTGSLDRLLELRGVNFYYTDLTAPGASAGLKTGFIAQEVETVFPEWITETKGMGTHDGLKGLTIQGFEALAVEAMRELKTENDNLKEHAASLEERVAELEALMSELLER